MKTKKTDGLDNLKRKLLDSTAIKSIQQELDIYERFKKLGWHVQHSPYYLDTISGKFREVDIKARKYWLKQEDEEFSFGINFVIECKSMNNYHIVLCNEKDIGFGRDLEDDWIGVDGPNNYPHTIQLLQKHNITDSDIQETLKDFHKHLFPNGLIRYIDYRLESFDIPVYCSFRETNIGTTKEMENSVVWKAYQGLYSVIRTYQKDSWVDIDYELYNIENEKYVSTYESKLKELKQTLYLASNHIEIIHPVLVVESKLWGLQGDDMEELKYCRLLFQEMSGFDKWIDIVNQKHLDEYLEKSKVYDDFFNEKGFENK